MKFTVQDIGVKVERVQRDIEWIAGVIRERAAEDKEWADLLDKLPQHSDEAVERVVNRVLRGLKTWEVPDGQGGTKTLYVK